MTSVEITRLSNSEFQTVYATNGGTDREPDAFHFQFNPERDAVTRAIVDAVALVHDCNQTELDPLANSIDPEALSTLMQTSEAPVEVVFQYEGMEITVEGDGDIWLRWH